MYKSIRIFLFTVMLACCAWLASFTFANQLQTIPKLDNPVMDTVNLLSTEEKNTLNKYLYDFHKKHGSQIVILIVQNTGSENIFDYSSRVFQEWKIGRTEYDDGVLIVVSYKTREIRINTGSGLEGAIPDITGKNIITRVIKPHFQKGDYFAGLFNASQALAQLILGEELPEYQISNSPDILSFLIFFIFLHYVLFFFRDGFSKTFASLLSSVFSYGLAESFGYNLSWISIIVFLSFFITYLGIMGIFINTLISNGMPRPMKNYSRSRRGPFDNFSSRGGSGFGGSSGGGFSGGGGGFSGGGASGGW